MEFLTRARLRNCPVEGCSGWAATRTDTKVHFWHRNVQDTMVILEEGTPPPLTMSLVQYDGAMAVPEYLAQCNSAV